ncbi:DUF1501 domain-containing protein [Anatilimnocola sp. NA78]|uniref:DUF1501 domain-containing protein n=1 Tax=Anatilimnocola sp. NA78 TaxID=3415683 RepID=UPI003CE48124
MNRRTRRQFLADAAATTATAGLVSLASSTPLFLLQSAASGAEQKGENILVVVQLTGGNDGLNTVIPYKDERYRRSRPSLAQDASSLIKLKDDLALHASLRGFGKIWEAGQLAIVQGVGYPNPNRSHFESMDIWHTATLKQTDRTSGWLGRTFDQLRVAGTTELSSPAMHLGGDVQPLALASRDVPTPSISSLAQFKLQTGKSETERQAVEAAMTTARSSGNDLLNFVTTRSTAAVKLSNRLQEATKEYSTSVQYPASSLAEKLKQVAQLIDAGLGTRVYYVTLDGFDTHSDQAVAHANLLQQLGDALAAFQEDLKLHGHDGRVASLVFSEFGRRVQENSSRGTDHGAAAPVFLLGTKIKPGLIGKHPDLGDLDDGDLKYHTDFRSVYASLLTNWLHWPVKAAFSDKVPSIQLFA